MPFKSKAQQRYMFANHPDQAQEMADKTKNFKKLPEKVEKKAEQKAMKDVPIGTGRLSRDGKGPCGQTTQQGRRIKERLKALEEKKASELPAWLELGLAKVAEASKDKVRYHISPAEAAAMFPIIGPGGVGLVSGMGSRKGEGLSQGLTTTGLSAAGLLAGAIAGGMLGALTKNPVMGGISMGVGGLGGGALGAAGAQYRYNKRVEKSPPKKREQEKVGMLAKVAQGPLGNPYAGHPAMLQMQRLQQAYGQQMPQQDPYAQQMMPQPDPYAQQQAMPSSSQEAVAAPPMTVSPQEAAQMEHDATISGRAAGLVGGGAGGYRLGGMVGNRMGRFGVLGRLGGMAAGAGLGALAGGLGAGAATRKLVEPSIQQPEEQLDYTDPRVLEYLSQAQGGY